MRALPLGPLVLAALAAGCTQKLPVYSRVEGLRIIGLRAEPPTFLVDQPPASVVVEALVLDPLGGPVDYTWQLCPVESTTACADFAQTAAEATGPDPATLAAEQAALASAQSLAASGSASPAGNDPLEPYTVASFTIPGEQLSALAEYFAYNGFFGRVMGAWPSAVLAVTGPDGDVTSQKRIPTLVADPSVQPWATIAYDEYRFRFCASGQTSGCTPWDPALAGNHNPTFASVQWAEGDNPLATWRTLPVPPLAPGAKIRLLPTFTDDSAERYQTVRTDLFGHIQVVEAEEKPSVSWFVTDGEIRDALTWPPFTKTLDTIYTAPSQSPAATQGRVTVWLVGRDQRGGETWTHVELQIAD